MADSEESARKFFGETQNRLQDLVRQLNNCKAQIFQRDRSSRMGEITLKELQSIKEQDPDVVTFKSVGKMFVRMAVDDLHADIKQKSEKDRRDVVVLEKTKQYLESNIVDQEKTLKEMLGKK